MKRLATFLIALLALPLVSNAVTVVFPNAGGTGASITTVVKGDLLAGSSSQALGRVSVGSDGTCLIASSSATYGITWGSCSTSSGVADGNDPYKWIANGTDVYSSSSYREVGINTTTPSSSLHVVGGLLVSTSSVSLSLTQAGVGVGTLVPSSSLHVVGTFMVDSASTFKASSTIQHGTASRLLYLSASKVVDWVTNLGDFVAGTTNQITVTNDGDGTITLSTPQNIHTAATPTFGSLTLNGSLSAIGQTTTSTSTQERVVVSSKLRIPISSSSLTTAGDIGVTGTTTSSLKINAGGNEFSYSSTTSFAFQVAGAGGITGNEMAIQLQQGFRILKVVSSVASSSGNNLSFNIGVVTNRNTSSTATNVFLLSTTCSDTNDCRSSSTQQIVDVARSQWITFKPNGAPSSTQATVQVIGRYNP